MRGSNILKQFSGTGEDVGVNCVGITVLEAFIDTELGTEAVVNNVCSCVVVRDDFDGCIVNDWMNESSEDDDAIE